MFFGRRDLVPRKIQQMDEQKKTSLEKRQPQKNNQITPISRMLPFTMKHIQHVGIEPGPGPSSLNSGVIIYNPGLTGQNVGKKYFTLNLGAVTVPRIYSIIGFNVVFAGAAVNQVPTALYVTALGDTIQLLRGNTQCVTTMDGASTIATPLKCDALAVAVIDNINSYIGQPDAQGDVNVVYKMQSGPLQKIFTTTATTGISFGFSTSPAYTANTNITLYNPVLIIQWQQSAVS